MAGMMFTVNGRFKSAVFCLALSGLCDMFDGKIARRKKDRTEDEKKFGIQIDSLCDVVCFGLSRHFSATGWGWMAYRGSRFCSFTARRE